jgi:hypothetical protein
MGKSIVIKNVHSMIDVITNSSTEIFIVASQGSFKYMYGFIDSILQASGSDKKAKDLFDIELVYDTDFIFNNFLGVDLSFSNDETLLELQEKCKQLPYKEREKFFEENGLKEVLEKNNLLEECNKTYDGFSETVGIKLISKNDSKETIDILDHFTKIFVLNSVYNN